MTPRLFCGTALVIFALSALSGPAAYGHFPWLDLDEEGHALLFFGESPADRTYHLPESIAKATVVARLAGEKEQSAELKMAAVEEDDFIGLRSDEKAPAGAALESTVQYGVYHGMLLTYYAKHLGGDAGEWGKGAASKDLKLDIVPGVAKDGLTVKVTWDGKPRADVAVAVIDSAGDSHEAKTDAQGEATFKKVAAGLVGVTVNFMEDAKGKLGDEQYTSTGHYGTMALDYRAAEGAATGALPALPEGLSSFGAAVSDGWLYVYSGHIGEEHAHSRDNLSAHFRRVKLEDGGQWEELPMQTPLQGLPLVAHDGKLYRVGGLSARNGADEEEDVHSVDEFAAFDPAAGQWRKLPPLPEPRSSHDAVVIGDRLCVVGGWKLTGSRKGEWLDTAWAFDLSSGDGSWQPLATPDFRRRALALAQWQGKLVALGGMNEKKGVTRKVHALDLAGGAWSELAELPGEGMDGFGAAAWNLDGDLYVSGTQESLFRLHDDGKKWEPVTPLAQPRFFHRLLPGEEGTLLAIGGASEEGHLATIESLRPSHNRPDAE